MDLKIWTLSQSWPTPDKVAEDYSHINQTLGHPAVVIDNGSACRAGWAGEKDPRLNFPNIVAKPKGGKRSGGVDDCSIGNSITYDQFTKWIIKGPQDRGVVVDLDTQELILDHVFGSLGMNEQPHPIVITEALCCPQESRAALTELLFEGYNIPSAAFGVDALFARSLSQPQSDTALVVNIGYDNTRVMPVVNGRLDACHARRLDVGVFTMYSTMSKLLGLKYPGLAGLNYSRVREIVHDHVYCAADYGQALDAFSRKEYLQQHTRRVQLPRDASDSRVVDEAAAQQRKADNANRLRGIHQSRRHDKVQRLEQRTTELAEYLAANSDDSDFDNMEAELVQLKDQIKTLNEKIKEGDLIMQEGPSSDKDAGGMRKRAKTHHGSTEDDSLRRLNPEQWYTTMQSERDALAKKIKERCDYQTALLTRRSAAAKERMRLLTQQAEGAENDSFGADDSDWAVYSQLDRHELAQTISDMETKLADIDTKMHEYRMEASDGAIQQADGSVVDLGIERIRVPEVLFQPHIIGLEHACGLGELMEVVLRSYSSALRNSLSANVFVTGGGANIRGLTDRIHAELRAHCPVDAPVNVAQALDPVLDAWRGASAWAHAVDLPTVSMTRESYFEHGGVVPLVEHSYGNQVLTPP
eukprot:m.591731 g.591731  ORF g.591731 m.591731 type:complete len:641 (+) comp22384_c0_seq4:235-2157(+)